MAIHGHSARQNGASVSSETRKSAKPRLRTLWCESIEGRLQSIITQGQVMLTAESKWLFPLDPEVTYLNHGAFGVTPHHVLNEKKRILSEIEKNPVEMLQHQIRERWHRIRNRVAEQFSCSANSVAIVDNATDGVVAVLRSLSLQRGDEILLTPMTYGAVTLAAHCIAEAHGAKVTMAALRFTNPDPQQCIEAVTQAISSRTRLAILDHITSSTALLMPLAAMAAACRERGFRFWLTAPMRPAKSSLTFPLSTWIGTLAISTNGISSRVAVVSCGQRQARATSCCRMYCHGISFILFRPTSDGPAHAIRRAGSRFRRRSIS